MYKRTLLSTAIAAATTALISGQSLAQSDTDNDESNYISIVETDNSDSPYVVEEVIVTGLKASLSKAIDIKRESFEMVESIVAEDIGKFPDNNVVEALQRLPGVQVTDRASGEVNGVSIRGLGDVTTLINGRQIYISIGRGYTLADTPASLIERVDVFKTRSAEQVETGIAGQIDVHTQRPFNFDGFKVVAAARGIYQDQSEETDPNASLLISNRWDTSVGDFGALFNVAYAETHWRDMNITSGAMLPFAGANPESSRLTAYQRIPNTLDVDGVRHDIWTAGTVEGLPTRAGSTIDILGVEEEYYLSRDAVFGSDYTGERERPAANLSFQWAPNDSSEYLFEAFYNGYRSKSFNSLFFTFVDSNANLNFDDEFTVYEGTNIIKERTAYNAAGFNSGDATESSTDSFVYALGGQWDLGSAVHLQSELVYQESKYETEFFAQRWNPRHQVNGAYIGGYYGVEVDFNAGNGIPSLVFMDNPETPNIDETDLTNPDFYTMGTAWDNGGRDEGSVTTLTVDGDWEFDFAGFNVLDFGLRYEYRQADQYTRGARAECANNEDIGFYCDDIVATDPDLPWLSEDFFDDRADFPTAWVISDGPHMFDRRDFYRDGYGFSQYPEGGERLYDNGVPTVFSLDYRHGMDAEETSLSAYVQASFLYEAPGGEIDGTLGLRYSSVSMEGVFSQYCRDPEAPVTSLAPETITLCTGESDSDTSKLLPSVMVRYSFLDDFLARVSYTETIRRPEFVSYNPLRSYTPDLTDVGFGTASEGNPDLVPVESQNLDLSLEYYFGDGNALYLSYFTRDITGLQVDTSRSIEIEGADYPFVLTRPDNASDGELSGVELGLVYFPSNLPGYLDGLGIQASYTSLESSQVNPLYTPEGEFEKYEETDMFGVSSSSYSAVLAYERDRFSSRLSYVWREAFNHRYEARQFANPLPIWRRPETSLDFQISYDVTDELAVTFDATNITNELYQEYYEYEDTNNFFTGNYSRTYALGIRFSY